MLDAWLKANKMPKTSTAGIPKDATSSFKTYYLPWQKVYDVGFRVMLEETN